MRRQGGVALAEDPVAVHAEVHEEECAVVEMQELVLAAPLRPRDPGAAQGAASGPRLYPRAGVGPPTAMAVPRS